MTDSSTTTHEYTNIGNNAALDNNAAFALLPVQPVNSDSLRTGSVAKKYLAILVVMLLSISSTELYALVTGPGSAWQFCRRITLSGNTPAADYQVKVTLTTAVFGTNYSSMKNDGSDIRFYDINNNDCSYWIETNITTSFNLGTTNNVIWVKIPTSGTNVLYMYYGNAAATAVSSGANTFPFFDDFNGALAGNWTTSTSGGTVTLNASEATIANTAGAAGNPGLFTQYTPQAGSFILEVKHREGNYNRNRFYASTIALNNPLANDYGYFVNGGTASTNGQVFYNGFQTGTTMSTASRYLSQWQITDGGAYNWVTYAYATGGGLTLNGANSNKIGTVAATIRYLAMSVTEVANTSSIIDWVRVRRWNGSNATPDITSSSFTSQVTNVSVSTSHTDVSCPGATNGTATATATGGGTPYIYSWNSTPTQSTQTATALPAGTFTVTVTENAIGISGTATATISAPATPVTSSVVSQNNITCFNQGNGQIVVGAAGGTSPYTYSVNNGAGYQASPTFTNLSPGQYKIRVKDNNGCQSVLIP